MGTLRAGPAVPGTPPSLSLCACSAQGDGGKWDTGVRQGRGTVSKALKRELWPRVEIVKHFHWDLVSVSQTGGGGQGEGLQTLLSGLWVCKHSCFYLVCEQMKCVRGVCVLLFYLILLIPFCLLSVST